MAKQQKSAIDLALEKAAQAVTQAVTSTPAPAPATVAGKLTPEQALVKIIRFINSHNTLAAVGYAANPTPYRELTIKQRILSHNLAVDLFGVGTKIELGTGKARREPTDADVASMEADCPKLTAACVQASKDGKNVRVVWAHQQYNPLVIPGEKQRKALSVAYGEVVAAGAVSPAQGYVEAVTEAVARGTLRQIALGPKRGYLVGVTDDVTQHEKEFPRAARVKSSTVASSLEMLQ